MDNRFKDENGNTDRESGEKFYLERREKLKQNRSNKKALDFEYVNYPLKSSEMFLRPEENDFPIADLKRVYSILVTREDITNASFKGFFEIDEQGKVAFKHDDNLRPIREFPFRGNEDIVGCVEMFEPPVRNAEGIIPLYTYIGGLDPVDDDDNSDKSRSLQSFFIFNTLTRRIVLEYTGRTRLAEEYYEQVRRAALYYNAVICYENQKKGFYGYMAKMNNLHILADTPEILRDNGLLDSIGSVGNKSKGIHTNDRINKWGVDLQISWML
jgi:hypothetical protein